MSADPDLDSAVTSWVVDPDRSTATVVERPDLDAGRSRRSARVTGSVQLSEDVAAPVVGGSIELVTDDEPPRHATIDVIGTTLELAPGPKGTWTLHGRTTRPAGEFGLTGSPLLNPSLSLRWRLTLVAAPPD